MSEGTPKAIEMKGIVRNATKIGVQDGQAEDLINLRFMDGSWRTSGDGRHVYSMTENAGSTAAEKTYTQLFIHTNVYRHLLGVRNVDGVDKLFWFASIDTDGVTFRPLKSGNSSSEDTFIKTLPDAPVELTTVHGDLLITQTGHLLTVIDGEDDFEYFVFKQNKYLQLDQEVNNKPEDRIIYPFGQVHFNLYEPSDEHDYQHQKINDTNWNYMTVGIAHADMLAMFKEADEKNQFTRPFLALVACKLYDGSYAYASQPVLIFPRELAGLRKSYCREKGVLNTDGTYTVTSKEVVSLEDIDKNHIGFIDECYSFPYLEDETSVVTLENVAAVNKANTAKAALMRIDTDQHNERDSIIPIPKKSLPVYASHQIFGLTKFVTCVMGSDLIVSIQNGNIIDGDVIRGIGIFITSQVDIFNMAADGYKDSAQYNNSENTLLKDTYRYRLSYFHRNDDDVPDADTREEDILTYIPGLRKDEEIIYDLVHSPFYLLREYDANELEDLCYNPRVDLSKPEYKSILKQEILVNQNTIKTEAFARTTYLPKISYMYNGRLHIANYYSYPYFGYPIDLFHLHNHSVKVQEDSFFKGVLPKLADNSDEYLHVREQVAIKNASTLGDSGALAAASAPYFLMKVYIKTAQGKQIVCRYIPAYDYTESENGRADFIEDLNPLLTYPDTRAYKIEIYYIDHYNAATSGVGSLTAMEGYYVKRKAFNLKPHPYLNLAYYIDPELKPIKLSSFESWPVYQQVGGR